MDAGANAREALKSAGSYLNGEMGAPAFVVPPGGGPLDRGADERAPSSKSAPDELDRLLNDFLAKGAFSDEGAKQDNRTRNGDAARVCSMIAPSHFKSHFTCRGPVPRLARCLSITRRLPVYVSFSCVLLVHSARNGGAAAPALAAATAGRHGRRGRRCRGRRRCSGPSAAAVGGGRRGAGGFDGGAHAHARLAG